MLTIFDLVLSTLLLVPFAVTQTNNVVILGYYDESGSQFLSPEDVPFSKLSHVNYGINKGNKKSITYNLHDLYVNDVFIPNHNKPFAAIGPDYKPTLTAEAQALLPRLVAKAHQNNVKVSLSVGGHLGSKYFSKMAAQINSRLIFITELVLLIKKYDLDGIDIVWQYPGRKDISCNPVDKANDANNLLNLLREIKITALFSTKLVTLAVRVAPFDINDTPMTDVSEFAKCVDFISIMTYDINVASSVTTGPNAPLDFTSGKGAQYSFKQAINSWLNAKVPANQLVLGFPFYGRSSTATVDMTQDPTNIYVSKSNVIPIGDQDDEMSFEPCPGSTETYSGIWKYRNLRSQGLLTSPTTAGNGWTRYWDGASQTPWLFNPATRVFISYDDVESFQIKVDYGHQKGVRGAMIWALHQDTNDELLNVVLDI